MHEWRETHAEHGAFPHKQGRPPIILPSAWVVRDNDNINTKARHRVDRENIVNEGSIESELPVAKERCADRILCRTSGASTPVFSSRSFNVMGGFEYRGVDCSISSSSSPPSLDSTGRATSGTTCVDLQMRCGECARLGDGTTEDNHIRGKERQTEGGGNKNNGRVLECQAFARIRNLYLELELIDVLAVRVG